MNKYLSKKAQGLSQGAIRNMFDRTKGMQDVISFGIGEPDMNTPTPICEAGIEALKNGYTHYTLNAGLYKLREGISQKFKSEGLYFNPDTEIIVTVGGMGALYLCFQVIINPGDEILIQDPQWLNYVNQVEYAGGVAVRIPTTSEFNFAMRPEEIERCITKRTKAIIINSPNNPTGSVLTNDQLRLIAEVAIKHDLIVISDEVYNTLIYDNAHACSIATMPNMGTRTIVVNSFSKSYAMTGWRVGYAAGPSDIIQKMIYLQENLVACASAPCQYAAMQALKMPELTVSLKEVFEHRRNIIVEALNEIPDMSCAYPQGAFYVFPDIRSYGLSSQEFCENLLKQAGVVCIPGSAFGKKGEGFIRMSYATSERNIREGLFRMSEFVHTLT